MIFSDDFLLDHSSRLIVDRMSDILIGSVFAFFWLGIETKNPVAPWMIFNPGSRSSDLE